jgi:hypothetical protein
LNFSFVSSVTTPQLTYSIPASEVHPESAPLPRLFIIAMASPVSGNETYVPSIGSFKVYKAPSSVETASSGTFGGNFIQVSNETDGNLFLIVHVPDSFFTMTSADMKLAQSQLAARTDALINAPLQSKTIQTAADKAAKLEKWPTVSLHFSCGCI